MPESSGNNPNIPQIPNPTQTSGTSDVESQPKKRKSLHTTVHKGSTQATTRAHARRRRTRAHTRNHAQTRMNTGASSQLAHNIDKPIVGIDDFMDMLCAIHFSSYVQSPVLDAGGLMLVAPSGSLKSSLLTALSNLYPSKCICDSNWYFGKLMKLCGSFYNRSIRSIIIPELASVYAGDPRTGGRMEQVFQQMAGEGSLSTNDSDTRFSRYEMRATIFAALTPEFAAKHHKKWEEGFHRRFLWAHMAMENDDVLMDYLIQWKRANIEMNRPIVEPAEGFIPDLLSVKEKSRLSKMLLEQKPFGPNQTRFVVFAKATSVLKWHYKRMGIKKDAMQTAKNFAGCLSSKAAILIMPRVQPEVKS